MSFGGFAVAVQFHVEIMENTVREWGEIPEYASALDQTLGKGAMQNMIQSADERMTEFNAVSKTLYDNFVSRVRQS